MRTKKEIPLESLIGPEWNKIQYKNREIWLKNRLIGASDSAALFGVGYADQTPMTIYERIVRQAETREDVARLKVGTHMEEAMRLIFLDYTGIPCLRTGIYAIHYNKEYPGMTASLDGICYDDVYGYCPVEFKNVDYFNGRDWEADSAPLKYVVQCQHQLAVTGAKRCYLFALIGGNNPQLRIIERDQTFIDDVLWPKCKWFFGLVKRNIPPPPDSSSATGEALGRLFLNDNSEAVQLSEDFVEYDKRYVELKQEIKTRAEELTEIENKIKAELQSNQIGLLPNGYRYTWKTQVSTYKATPEHTRTSRVLRRSKA